MMLPRLPASTTATAHVPHDGVERDLFVSDSYFTDGINLYRFIGWLSRDGETPLAEIEDCRSLRCWLVPCRELADLGLALVRSGGSPVALESSTG